MSRALLLLCAVSVSASCGSPFAVDALADTRIRAACHFAYACCTPTEQSLFIGLDYKDEGACVSETEADASTGFFFQIDAEAKDAVDRKAATYDAAAAERCSRPQLDAVNQCNAAGFFDAGGLLDAEKLELLADTADPVCLALAQRNFTRGTVKDGGACSSSLDCADFGACVADPAKNPGTVSAAGACHTPHKLGEDCSDGNGCEPGGLCAAPTTGVGPSTCTPPRADGSPCDFSTDCASGNCAQTIEDGSCFNTGKSCTVDTDCGDTDFCNGNTVVVCAAKEHITVDVCNGP